MSVEKSQTALEGKEFKKLEDQEQDIELAARIAKRVEKESDRYRSLIGKLPDRRKRDSSVEL